MVKLIIFDFWGTLVENGIFPSPVRQVKYILRIEELIGIQVRLVSVGPEREQVVEIT